MGAPTGWDPHGGPEGEPLCYRDPWKVGTCWVGDDLPAISGIGSNHDAMLDGVRIFDVEDRRGIISFAGPRGWFFGDCRRLCSASPHGLEIWDPTTGERTGSVPRIHAYQAEERSARRSRERRADHLAEVAALTRWSVRAAPPRPVRAG